MKRLFQLFFIVATSILIFGCGGGSGTKTTTSAVKPHKLNLPIPPAIMTDNTERAHFVVRNYWQEFDFRDTTWISDTAAFEQTFVDYLSVVPYASEKVGKASIAALIDSAATSPAMLSHFFNIAERYLYDPNSPMRNEEMYIIFLQSYLAQPSLDELNALRPNHQLSMAMKNRRGELANDFLYTTDKGKTGRLYDIKSKYTIIFFNNPDCHDCARVKELLNELPNIVSKIKDKSLQILALYPDEDIAAWNKTEYNKSWINSYDKSRTLTNEQLYDLRAIPTLHLLDADKRVVLKDAEVEQIEDWLSQNN